MNQEKQSNQVKQSNAGNLASQSHKPVSIEDLKNRTISIFEPFSHYLQGSEEEKKFNISLLDVVRFAGHACPSMIGAFLIAECAIQKLFPETGTCVRGEVEIDIPTLATQGATGPMSNVFGFIFGAWGETGFGGLQGQFARRGLMHYGVPDLAPGSFRFRNTRTGSQVEVSYNPSLAPFDIDPQTSFQTQWRYKIKAILENRDLVITSMRV